MPCFPATSIYTNSTKYLKWGGVKVVATRVRIEVYKCYLCLANCRQSGRLLILDHYAIFSVYITAI